MERPEGTVGTQEGEIKIIRFQRHKASLGKKLTGTRGPWGNGPAFCQAESPREKGKGGA